MKKVAAVFDRVLDCAGAIAAFLVVAMMLVVTGEVLSRALFGRPVVWVIEIIQYSLVVMTFLGAAWLLRREGHVVMDFVLNRVEQRQRAWLNAYTSIFCAIVTAVVFWFALTVTLDYYKIHYVYQGTLEFPAFFIQSAVPIGALMLSIQFIRRARGYWRKARNSPGPVAQKQ